MIWRGKAEAGYLGAIGGGLAGVLIGSQIGGGDGKAAAQVAGAVGAEHPGKKKPSDLARLGQFTKGGAGDKGFDGTPVKSSVSSSGRIVLTRLHPFI